MMRQRFSLVPLMASWHLRYPTYNSESVRQVVADLAADAVVLGPVSPDTLGSPSWQDTPEIALPLSVMPWLKTQPLNVYEGIQASLDPRAEADFKRYAKMSLQLQQQLTEVERLLEPVAELLRQPLTLARLWQELLPAVSAYQNAREAAFGDGPATDWLGERMAAWVARLKRLPEAHVVILAGLETLPYLEAHLSGAERVMEARITPAVRQRSLLDVAFWGEVADPEALLGQLREVGGAEARFHEANILLRHAHVAEAYERLLALSQENFQTPYYLPGFLLARLGQVADLVGERKAALRAYRGVLALDWVPQEALVSAQRGLDAPFTGEHEAMRDNHDAI